MFGKSVRLIVRTYSFVERRNLSTQRIGFIGLGNMGTKMAGHLVSKGNEVRVFDTSPEALRSVPSSTVCKSAKEVTEGANVVITMLPNGSIVRDTLLGPDGLLPVVSKDTVLVDCSTIDPAVAQELAAASGAVGVRFLDAPVSGGVPGAAAATLTFMVGGEKEVVDLVTPVLQQMGSRVQHCGKNGSGQVAKICNNLILAATMAATSEAMNLGIKMGLDPKILTSIVNTSTGRSWSSEMYNPVPGIVPGVPASMGYDGGFMCSLVAKDLGLAETVALTCGVPVPVTALTHQLYRTILAHGYGGKDITFMFQYLQGKEK